MTIRNIHAIIKENKKVNISKEPKNVLVRLQHLSCKLKQKKGNTPNLVFLVESVILVQRPLRCSCHLVVSMAVHIGILGA